VTYKDDKSDQLTFDTEIPYRQFGLLNTNNKCEMKKQMNQ